MIHELMIRLLHAWIKLHNMNPYANLCLLVSADIITSVHKLRKITIATLRKLYFHFLSQWMGYDRGDSFWTIWNFHLVQKLSPRSNPIQFKRKWKYSFLNVRNATTAMLVKQGKSQLGMRDVLSGDRWKELFWSYKWGIA